MTKYVVIAEYVTLKVRDQATGATVVNEFYRGATVPETADQENVDRLVDKGMVAEQGSQEAELLGTPAGTPVPGEPPNVPATEQTPTPVTPADRLRRAQDAAEQSRTDQSGRPAVNAPKADWVAYAVDQRPDDVTEEAAREEAEAMTKADLIARHGGSQG